MSTTTTANHPTTGKPGYYRFEVVCRAAYKVRVKASNFASDGVLDDHVLATRNAAADLTVDFGFVLRKMCDKDDKYGHDRDDCDRDDDRCDKDDKYRRSRPGQVRPGRRTPRPRS